LVILSSNHPFSWTCTIIAFGNGSFGIAFLLKTTYGGSFPPSAVQANITVKRFFSFPVVLMVTVDDPFGAIVVSDGKSNVSGVWSALPICERS
jgi:hypothetical protein